MKLVNLKKLFLCVVLPGVIQAEYFLLDEIKLVVCGPEKNTPFTDTDETWKRGLDGKSIPLTNQVQKEIINQQVVADKLPIEPDAAKKYVESIKKQNNFSELDLAKWFAEVGKMYHEGVEFFTTQYNNEFFMHYKFKSQLAPTEDEIMEYYDENPEFIDAAYKMRGTRVSYQPESQEQLKQDLEKMIQDERDHQKSEIEWSEPLVVLEEELPEDKKFLADMKPGEIKMLDINGVFELYQLLDYIPAALVPLEDRRTTIVDVLNRGKLEKMLADYNKSIQEFVGIINFE